AARVEALDESHQIDRVPEGVLAAVVGGAIRGQVASERQDVADARRRVALEELADLVLAVTDAGQVGDRGELRRLLDLRDQVVRQLARRAARPVRHGDERGAEPLEAAQRLVQRAGLLLRLRREELERAGAGRGPK